MKGSLWQPAAMCALSICIFSLLALPISAEKSPALPREVIKAVQIHAARDMRIPSGYVQVFTTAWSVQQSKGLLSNLSNHGQAWLAHAKHLGGETTGRGASTKTKGTYLVVQSAVSKRGLKVFPLGLCADKKGQPIDGCHIATIDYLTYQPSSTYVVADGATPGTEIVHGIKAKNVFAVSGVYQRGQIVAQKQEEDTLTYFLLGVPLTSLEPTPASPKLMEPEYLIGSPSPKLVETKFWQLKSSSARTIAAAQAYIWGSTLRQ